jgi:hypothetical protein
MSLTAGKNNQKFGLLFIFKKLPKVNNRRNFRPIWSPWSLGIEKRK